MYETTTITNVRPAEKPEAVSNGHLFICIGRNITEHVLKGHQQLGRPDETGGPDIKIANRFVSRRHGFFDTVSGKTSYTAQKTTNGIQFKGRLLEPGERIELEDGDELFIPCVGEDENESFMLVYADSAMRLNIWHELQQTSRDPLTGMFNRGGFEMWWTHHYRNSDYANACLFLLDLDDFKLINDRYGHNRGDRSLQAAASLIMGAVRYDHQVCRWGGDEFIGIIPGSPENVEKRLGKLAAEISEAGEDLGLPMSTSIGYVDIHITPNVLDIEALVNFADKAMYRIKNSGKNGIARYVINPLNMTRDETENRTGEFTSPAGL